jgi:ABC-type Fe3+ transport system substrate-binding protein
MIKPGITRRAVVAGAAATPILLISRTQAQQNLVDAGKAEREVVWYTVQTIPQLVRPVAAAFEKKYGIKVSYIRANASDISLRIMNEAKAGRVNCDVFDGTTTAVPLKRAGLVEKWLPEETKTFDPRTVDAEGYWVANNFFTNTLAINTDLVRPADEPKTYEDLLNPKWKGKIAWGSTPSTSAGPGFVGLMIKHLGRDRAMDFLRKLAAQDVAAAPVAARQVLDRVIAGEYAIGINMFNHHAVISAAKAAPVKWLPISPAMVTMNTSSLMKNAPHPNAARLFMSFLVSEEGQKLFAAEDYLPVHPKVPPKDPALMPDGKGFSGLFFTPEESEGQMDEWMKIFRATFR